MDKDKDFRVVDRRASSGTEDRKDDKPASAASVKAGEGFVMRDTKSSDPTEPGQIDFATFIFSLATGALIQMGLAPDPTTKKIQKNVELARQNIELLALLKEKTRGNLTEEEEKLLDNLLMETRLRFVDASK